MTDAVKMALEALADIRTSIECAAGCDEGIAPMAAVSEIMSAYGTAMASAYSRAADMVTILAALEQAGEPVAKLHYSGDVMEAVQQLLERGRATLDSEGYLVAHPAASPMSEIQRLGQEFDAGERLAKRIAETMDEDGGCWSACSGCQESVDGYVSTRDYPYSPIFKCQPGSGCRECGGIGVTWLDGAFLAGYGDALSEQPQSRGQAFDGEGEAAIERVARAIDPSDWTNIDHWWGYKGTANFDSRIDDMRNASMERARAAIAALSSAKRGEEG